MSSYVRLFFIAIFFALCGLISSSPLSSAGSYEVADMAGVEIAIGEYYVWNLGELEAHTEIYFYVSTEGKWSQEEEFDCLFMNQSQYDSWDDGDSLSFNSDASAFAVDGYEPYYYTLNGPPYSPLSDSYYYVIDNRNGISDIVMDVIADIDAYTPPPGDFDYRDIVEYKTRIWLTDGDLRFREIGDSRALEDIQLDSYIRFDVEARLSSGDLLSFMLLEEEETNKWLNGDMAMYNRNASISLEGSSWMSIASETWYYEPTEVKSWYLLVTADALAQGTHIDISFSVDLIPKDRYLEFSDYISRTTRFIPEDDSWLIDLGQLDAGHTISFDFNPSKFDRSDGKIDVFVMEKAEAERYLTGQEGKYEVLGHPSLIGVEDWETWYYNFPVSGHYCVILDNTKTGSSSNGAVQVAVSISNSTSGMHKTTHYISKDSYLSFELGHFTGGNDFYYSFNGDYYGSEDIGIFSGLDVMLMNNPNYQNYVGGLDFEFFDEVDENGNGNYSRLDDNYGSSGLNSIPNEEGDYWLVIDTTSVPLGGAGAAGPWAFEISICLYGTYSCAYDQIIPSPQAVNEHYKMTITIVHSSGNDDTTGGEDTGGEDTGVDTEEEDTGGNGTKEEELVDLTEAKPESDSPSIGFLMVSLCLIACAIFSKRHKI